MTRTSDHRLKIRLFAQRPMYLPVKLGWGTALFLFRFFFLFFFLAGFELNPLLLEKMLLLRSTAEQAQREQESLLQAHAPHTFASLIPIYQIQGTTDHTLYYQQWVDTYGVVTAVINDGFYLQDSHGDGDDTTSDGIFVYTRIPPAVAVGQCIEIQRAYVDEFYEKTELSRIKAIQLSTQCATTEITPVPLPPTTLTQSPEVRYEQYEGMVVTITGRSEANMADEDSSDETSGWQIDHLQGIVQGPTKYFANGEKEIALLPRAHLPYVDGGRVFQNNAQSMDALLYLSNELGADLPDVRWGDTLIMGGTQQDATSIRAILDFNFGKYQLLLWPDTQFTVQRLNSALPSLDNAPEITDAEFTVCTYNLHGLGRGSEQYWQSTEYDLQLAKRSRTIAESLAGCTIIGLQEAGNREDLERLAAHLRENFALDYDVVALPGPNTASNEFPLTNGLIARREEVRVVAATAEQGCSTVDYDVIRLDNDCPIGIFPLFNRPPLVVDLIVEGAWGAPFPLTVVVNHWKSKGGDETINAVRRQEQARHVARLVQERLDIDPDGKIIILGDLNDYYTSTVVEKLRTGTDPPLQHTFDYLPLLDRYTYIFNGGSQVLDHILVTPNLTPMLARIDPIHVNVDYPAGDNQQLALLQQSSDHDPVLLQIRPGGVAMLGGNFYFPQIELSLWHAPELLDLAQSNGGKVDGRDLPVDGILVQGVDEARLTEGVEVARAVTNANGEFRFWAIPPGTYYLRVEAPTHFSPTTQTGILSLAAGYQTLADPSLSANSLVQSMSAQYTRDGNTESLMPLHRDILDAVTLMQMAPLLVGSQAQDQYEIKDETP